MTIRNLEYLFRPASVTVIGDTAEATATDVALVQNLLAAGFPGAVMPVNPQRQALGGILAYPDVDALPLTPDLALVTSALETAPALLSALGRRGTRAAALINTDMLPARPDAGAALTRALLEAARPHLMRIAGPDCLGLAAPGNGLNATLAPTRLLRGQLALVTQSCALARTVMDWASSHQLGFSHVVSLGAMIDVDFGDMLDYLARDAQTRAILLYVESIANARKFMTAARTASRIKPVVALRPRNYRGGPVQDAIYDAAFRRAGIMRVESIEQLFNAVETLATLRPISNRRLAILGNSRSLGVLASDTLTQYRGTLAELSDMTRRELAALAPPGPRTENPVDLADRSGPEGYARALDALLKDPGVDGILVLHAPTDAERDLACARTVIEKASGTRRLIVTAWLGSAAAEPSRALFRQHQVATYSNPGAAVEAFCRVGQYRRMQDLLMETPASIPEEFSPDLASAKALLARARGEGRERLDALEAKALLAAYQIPVVEALHAATPAEVETRCREIGSPVVLKILSLDIVDKSDVGGVVFGLVSPGEARDAATAMLKRVRSLAPKATLRGFEVQAMLPRDGAYELTIGVRTGQGFGPLIRFGHGGTETEVINDLAYALPPLNMALARDLITRTRVSARLGSSLARPANIDALALTLIKVSQMVIDLGEIVDIDINPLWVNGDGVLALDGSVHIQDPAPAHDRLAIRPYPKELESTFALPDGREFRLRPIVPEDEPPLQAMVRRMPAEDLRLRFFQPIKELSHAMAARLTQLDYDREMALAITGPGLPGQADIWGVVRATADPNQERAEYAIILDRSMTGIGLGPMLMRQIIDYARSRGIRELYGEVLRENESMLKLNRALGFTIRPTPDDPGILHVTLAL